MQAVIFDMDGVLVDNSKVHDQTWQMMCQKYGRPEMVPLVREIFGGTNKVFVERLLGITDTKRMNEIAIEKEALYREVFAASISAPDGLMNLLFELRKNNYRLAVGTSAPTENLDFVLDKLDIRNFFDILVDESQVTHGKPDPEIYLKSSNLLGIEPKNCLVIEDSVLGIEAAKAAGMKVVAITTSFTPDKLVKADMIINNFNELTMIDVSSILNS